MLNNGKWANKYDRCINCHTKRIRHEANGLCINCYDKKRYELNKNCRVIKNRNAKKSYFKNKGTSEFKKKRIVLAKKWRLTNKYKKLLIRLYLIRKYKKFINPKRFLKRNLGGIKYNCDGCNKKCLTVTPFKKNDLIKINGIKNLKLFKKLVIKYCKNKI